MTTCAETDCQFRTFGGWCGLTACIRRNTTTEIGANPGWVIPEDYVKVVRCRYCKWFDCKNYVCNNDILAGRIADCGCYPNFNVELDWFCADGERRESE